MLHRWGKTLQLGTWVCGDITKDRFTFCQVCFKTILMCPCTFKKLLFILAMKRVLPQEMGGNLQSLLCTKLHSEVQLKPVREFSSSLVKSSVDLPPLLFFVSVNSLSVFPQCFLAGWSDSNTKRELCTEKVHTQFVYRRLQKPHERWLNFLHQERTPDFVLHLVNGNASWTSSQPVWAGETVTAPNNTVNVQMSTLTLF